MHCDCIAKVNDGLAKEGLALKLHPAITWSTGVVEGTLCLETVAVRRGAKCRKLFPAYCPFCGKSTRKTATENVDQAKTSS